MLQNGDVQPHWSECVAADCAEEEERQQQLSTTTTQRNKLSFKKDESSAAGAQQGSGIPTAAGLLFKFLVPAEELDLPALRLTSTQQNWSGEEFGCRRQKQKVGKQRKSVNDGAQGG